MACKIKDETISFMQSLYKKGESIPDIAEIAGVSYATAYRHLRVFERGFTGRMQYEDHIASQNGFASYNDYKKALARRYGFTTRGAYETCLVEKRGFSSYTAYQEFNAIQTGYPSYNDYREEKAEERSRKPINRMLSALLRQRLHDTNHSQRWLSSKIHKSRHQVSLYIHGKSVPSKEVLASIFNALEVNCSLEDILNTS